MVFFNSIVVLDLETTGLPFLEHNTTRVTELAVLGCEIQHLKDALQFPRVLHKLVFCFNPLKKIQPSATNASGLDNELLEKIKPFTEKDAEILKHFIERLPSPVCMIAHNGNKFDFPILRRQLLKLNIALPNDIYCADSLVGFREIYPKRKNKPPLEVETSQKIPKKTEIGSEEISDKQKEVIGNEETSENQKPVTGNEETPEKQKTVIGNEETPDKQKGVIGKEETPEKQKTVSVNILNYASKKGLNQNEEIKISYDKIHKNVCKNLFPESQPTKNNHSVNCDVSFFLKNSEQSPFSYKLGDIYYFLHKTKLLNAHRAEEDCKALLSCIIKCDSFIQWINENSVTFNSVEPLF